MIDVDVACIFLGNQLYKVKHTIFDDAKTPQEVADKSLIKKVKTAATLKVFINKYTISNYPIYLNTECF